MGGTEPVAAPQGRRSTGPWSAGDRSALATRRARHQGGLPLPVGRGGARRVGHGAAAAGRRAAGRPALLHGRRGRRGPPRRGRRLLRPGHPRGRARRGPADVARRAFAGLLWTRAAVPLRRRGVAPGRPGLPAAAAGAAGARARRPEHLVAQRRPRRRHLDAGRVGVPLVRDLGPRLPRRRAVARRPRLREVAAAAALPGVGPASERSAPRLRVGVLRREPARARVGRVAGLPARRRRGPATSSSASSPSCCSTSRGG